MKRHIWRSEWAEENVGVAVMVMDGDYPMGRLIICDTPREILVENAIFVGEKWTDRRPEVFTPRRRTEVTRIRAKGEDYRRQIKEETKKIGDCEQHFLVFPDFEVRNRKLDPLIYKVIQDGHLVVEYSFIKHVVDSGLINHICDSWTDEERREYLFYRTLIHILDGDKIMGIIEGREGGKFVVFDTHDMSEWHARSSFRTFAPAEEDRGMRAENVKGKGRLSGSIRFPDFCIEREELYQLISRYLFPSGLTDSDFFKVQYDTLKELVEHGRMNK